MRCGLDLDDHASGTCPDPDHQRALAARWAARQGAWAPIVRRAGEFGGDFRDYLTGQAIHCGAMLELQHIDACYDDYGSYTAWLQRGTPVRYEHSAGKVFLYTNVGGYSFSVVAHEDMRFRWPGR